MPWPFSAATLILISFVGLPDSLGETLGAHKYQNRRRRDLSSSSLDPWIWNADPTGEALMGMAPRSGANVGCWKFAAAPEYPTSKIQNPSSLLRPQTPQMDFRLPLVEVTEWRILPLPIQNPTLPPAMPVRAAPGFSKLANARSAFKIPNPKSLHCPLLTPDPANGLPVAAC